VPELWRRHPPDGLHHGGGLGRPDAHGRQEHATHQPLIRSGTVAKVPLAGLSFAVANLDTALLCGHTFGMKTAVSIPDDVFEDAERLASRLQTSRSKLYARAVAEFVARHDDDRITALMDEAVREAGGQPDPFVAAAAKQSVQRAEW